MTTVERLRDAYRRFARGDAAGIFDLLDAGATYHLPGRHMGGGTLVGRDAIFRRLAQAGRWCTAAPEIDLLGVTGGGSFVTSVEYFRARRDPTRLDQIVAVVWRFEGERCVELWAHFARQAACDAFWCGFVKD